MANTKIKDLTAKTTVVASDELVINDVAAGNADKKEGMDDIRTYMLPTNAETKTAYEANSDTNEFSDAEQTVVGNTSNTNTGDEPDANLTTKGIVELATIAEVNTGTDAGRAVTPDSLEGSALQIKVDGIEVSADVTDITNVNAAAATIVGTIATGTWEGTAITTNFIGADSIDGTKMVDDAVNSEHYTDGSIDLVHMSANSVDSDQYVDASIDVAHMSINSIDSNQYIDGSIDVEHLSSAVATRSIQFVIDGGGSAITTGVKGYLEIPFACTINRVTLLADQSGSIVIDIWKDSYANYPPTNADTITASAVPTISATTKSQDATLTGWTTSIAAGDVIGFNVDSITTVERVTLSLRVEI